MTATAQSSAQPLETRLRSATKEVVLGHEHRFCIIGERINPTGRRIFQEQLRAGDLSAIEEHQPDIVGFSAFLTTTMPMFKANINALEKAGLRDQVVIMVGGAPVTQEYADAVGADAYAADASATVKKAKDLVKKKRAAVAV